MLNGKNEADKKKLFRKPSNEVAVEVPYSKERRMSRMGMQLLQEIVIFSNILDHEN